MAATARGEVTRGHDGQAGSDDEVDPVPGAFAVEPGAARGGVVRHVVGQVDRARVHLAGQPDHLGRGLARPDDQVGAALAQGFPQGGQGLGQEPGPVGAAPAGVEGVGFDDEPVVGHDDDEVFDPDNEEHFRAVVRSAPSGPAWKTGARGPRSATAARSSGSTAQASLTSAAASRAVAPLETAIATARRSADSRSDGRATAAAV